MLALEYVGSIVLIIFIECHITSNFYWMWCNFCHWGWSC